MINILVIVNNNCFLYKNNIEYVQAKFIQASKITKGLIKKFCKNLDLVLIWKYLN